MVKQTYAASGYEGAREIYLRTRLKDLGKRELQKRFNPLEAAVICAALGNRDEAFKWLEKSYEDRVQGLIYLKSNPEFDNLRSDPRFADLTRRIGLP